MIPIILIEIFNSLGTILITLLIEGESAKELSIERSYPSGNSSQPNSFKAALITSTCR